MINLSDKQKKIAIEISYEEMRQRIAISDNAYKRTTEMDDLQKKIIDALIKYESIQESEKNKTTKFFINLILPIFRIIAFTLVVIGTALIFTLPESYSTTGSTMCVIALLCYAVAILLAYEYDKLTRTAI